MSPLPFFLVATAAMAAFAFYLLVRMFHAPLPSRRTVPLRRKRAEEQIRWDRMHPPTAGRV